MNTICFMVSGKGILADYREKPRQFGLTRQNFELFGRALTDEFTDSARGDFKGVGSDFPKKARRARGKQWRIPQGLALWRGLVRGAPVFRNSETTVRGSFADFFFMGKRLPRPEMERGEWNQFSPGRVIAGCVLSKFKGAPVATSFERNSITPGATQMT